MYNFIKTISEGRTPKTLERITLGYALGALEDSVSKETMEYHYGKLYKAYVDRFNNGEGDAGFNEAGAFLHSIYFAQFQHPTKSNEPTGDILEFINRHFKSVDNFKEKFLKTAMAIQGSGWVYLAKNGEIKTIVNHEIKKDIVLLIDWWEHSWALDHQSDKEKYLENQWKIVDWEIISLKLQ